METNGNLPINDLGTRRPMVTCPLMIWAHGDKWYHNYMDIWKLLGPYTSFFIMQNMNI